MHSVVGGQSVILHGHREALWVHRDGGTELQSHGKEVPKRDYMEHVTHHAGLRENTIHWLASEACYRFGENQSQPGAAEHEIPHDTYTA